MVIRINISKTYIDKRQCDGRYKHYRLVSFTAVWWSRQTLSSSIVHTKFDIYVFNHSESDSAGCDNNDNEKSFRIVQKFSESKPVRWYWKYPTRTNVLITDCYRGRTNMCRKHNFFCFGIVMVDIGLVQSVNEKQFKLSKTERTLIYYLKMRRKFGWFGWFTENVLTRETNRWTSSSNIM